MIAKSKAEVARMIWKTVPTVYKMIKKWEVIVLEVKSNKKKLDKVYILRNEMLKFLISRLT